MQTLPVFATNFLTNLPFGQPVLFFWLFMVSFGSKDLLPIKTQRRLVKMSILSVHETGYNDSYNKLVSDNLEFTGH